MNPMIQQALRILAKVAKYFFATVLVLFVLTLIAGEGIYWVIEIPFRFLLGWIGFLDKVWPHITVNVGMVAMGLGGIAALYAGSHLFLAWVYQNYGTGQDGQVERPLWRPRWTLAVTTIFLTMFVTSIAFTGVVHQVTWLVTSPSSLLVTQVNRSWAQREARTNLGGIFVSEIAFYSEYGRYGTFEEIGFTPAGTSNGTCQSCRYTYRIDTSGKPGTVISAGKGPGSTPDNVIVPAGYGATGFTATATANLDNDPVLDQWHVNDAKCCLTQADVNDATD